MKKKIAVLALLVLGFASCFAAHAKRYFELRASSPPAGPALARTLLLERVDISEFYDDFRIVYRLSPTEVNYYPYDFWTEKPSRLIHHMVLERLLIPGRFLRIDTEAGKEPAEWQLKMRVFRIEEVDEGERWFGRLAMNFEVVDLKTGAVIATRSFDRSEPLGLKDVTRLPAVLSSILLSEIDAFLGELAVK
jgi:ABC-type uncharacterized transport system auxiliary subunit